jgi:cytochrome c biogenesis protein
VTFYDAKGAFAGVRRAGSGTPIEVEGRWFVVDRLVGASGLQLKHDPGVATVYAGFAALMLTTVVSYTSFSQVWALQEGSCVHVGGRANRAVVSFESELGAVLDAVPEAPAEA